MLPPREIYDLLIAKASCNAPIQEVILGLTWTWVQVEEYAGLAMSPALQTRTLPWSGTLQGRTLAEIAPWILHWNAHEACVAMAAINARINQQQTDMLANSIALPATQFANLAVFEYFLPRLRGQKVVVVGRYPHLEQYTSQIQLHILERQPNADDYPDPACEYLLPEADWVFLTASSLCNKTFPRLLELSRHAHVVLLGPTAPWLPELADFGIEFLAATQIAHPHAVRQTVAEGGGVRIFEVGVNYHIIDLQQGELLHIKQRIADVAQRREVMKVQIATWMQRSKKRCPYLSDLEALDNELSALDSRYKYLWDARHGRPATV